MKAAVVVLGLLAWADPAAAQWTYPAYNGPDPESDRRWELRDVEQREAALKRRESEAVRLDRSRAKDKRTACGEYDRRLRDVRESAGRPGGDARHMEHLNELRRRLDAARFTAGC